jgi:hypothetical protein
MESPRLTRCGTLLFVSQNRKPAFQLIARFEQSRRSQIGAGVSKLLLIGLDITTQALFAEHLRDNEYDDRAADASSGQKIDQRISGGSHRQCRECESFHRILLNVLELAAAGIRGSALLRAVS